MTSSSYLASLTKQTLFISIKLCMIYLCDNDIKGHPFIVIIYLYPNHHIGSVPAGTPTSETTWHFLMIPSSLFAPKNDFFFQPKSFYVVEPSTGSGTDREEGDSDISKSVIPLNALALVYRTEIMKKYTRHQFNLIISASKVISQLFICVSMSLWRPLHGK